MSSYRHFLFTTEHYIVQLAVEFMRNGVSISMKEEQLS